MMLRAFREVGGVWIFKPVGRAQGKGIFLVNKPSQVEAWLRERAVRKTPSPHPLLVTSAPAQATVRP